MDRKERERNWFDWSIECGSARAFSNVGFTPAEANYDSADFQRDFFKVSSVNTATQDRNGFSTFFTEIAVLGEQGLDRVKLAVLLGDNKNY